MQRHHDLLERRVAGALADAVDRALHLTRAALDRRQRVGHRQAEIVVAVRAEDDLVGVRDALADAAEEVQHFVRRRVADGIGQIDRRRADLDDRLDDAAEEVEVASRGVLGRELHVEGVLARVADRVHRRLEALLAGHAQLRLQVQIRGRDERVDAALRRRLDRPGRLLEVGAMAARQAGDDRTADLGGDLADRFGVGRRGDRKAGLDDVHAERIELTGELQLLGRPEREPGRLLAVAQRRVEDSDVVLPHVRNSPSCQ